MSSRVSVGSSRFAGCCRSPRREVKRREREPSERALRDARLLVEIRRVYEASGRRYGARKVWWRLEQEGISVARCTVERLMAQDGLQGVLAAKRRRTTIGDENVAERPPDLLQRDFSAAAPNRRWVADFTYVATWSGVVYVAFVIDIFSRRIVGWKADTSMKTPLVLDTLEMALWARDHAGRPIDAGQLIHHSDAGSQYTSFAFTTRLIDAGVEASIGSVGDAYDNALAESAISLYKREVIRHESPWKSIEQVELSTLEWVDWYNNSRLHGACGKLSPAAYEQAYYDERARSGRAHSDHQDQASPLASTQ